MNLAVIKRMYNKYSEALSKQDCDGCLPIHYTLENNAPFNVAEFLIENQPYGLLIPDNYSCLPIHVAFANEPLEVVEYLTNRQPDTLDSLNNDDCIVFTQHVAMVLRWM
jgi:hypothetical protein